MGVVLGPDAASELSPINFAVPEQFYEVDLDERPEQRAHRQYELLSRTFRGIEPAQCIHMTLAQEMAIAHLIRNGAVYVASCFARSEADPTQAVTAQFSVLVKETDLNGERPLLNIANGLKEPGEPREVILNEFPAGEALVIGDEVLLRQPSISAGIIQTRRIRQAQVIFALPGQRAIAMFSMSTESVADWDHFVEVLNTIAHSVSFKARQNSAIADRLSG